MAARVYSNGRGTGGGVVCCGMLWWRCGMVCGMLVVVWCGLTGRRLPQSCWRKVGGGKKQQLI